MPSDAGLHLTQLGIFESHGRFVWEQVSPGTTVHAILDGKGTVICDGGSFSVQKSDLLIFRKDHTYRYYDDPESPWKYIYVTLAGYRAEMLINDFGATSKNPVLNIPSSTPFWIKLQSMAREFQADQINGISAVRAAWEFIEILKEQLSRSTVPQKDSLARNARQIIESSPHTITNVNDLAASLNVNRVTLFRCFKEHYHISIKAFMEQVRFERLEPLLKNSDLSIQEISRIGGFNDPLYFSRSFRKRYGVSPTEWQTRERQKNERK